mgnify:CR=1 FL=1
MSLTALLDDFGEAIRLGESMGLDDRLGAARQTLVDARSREGFPGEAFVLALIGGTGVGKSSLLNKIAGEEVSTSSVLRPTTDSPRAWVAAPKVDEVEPILEWLGVDEVVAHSGGFLAGVAMLDMPDFDSIAKEHRLTVDQLLPRIDAVLWIVDPEKYDDERLYEYLRGVAGRAEDFHIALNKIDLLDPRDAAEIERDLEGRLRLAGIADPSVHLVSAATGEGISDLVAMLEEKAATKRVVFEKLRADVLDEMSSIANLVGAATPSGRADSASLQLTESRSRAVDAAIDLVDTAGIGRQITAAYLERARVSAGSILGRIGALFRLVFGATRRKADPVRYARNWRSRGDVDRAVNVVRQAYLDATAGIPPEGRAEILDRLDPDAARDGVIEALDTALAGAASDIAIRTPLLWRILGVVQLIATAGILVAIAWFLTLLISPGVVPVDSVEVPIAGPVPMPLVLLVASALLSFLVGGIVRIHASWLGSRQARAVAGSVRDRVAEAVDEHGFGLIHRLQEDRAALGELMAKVREGGSYSVDRRGPP